MGRARRKNPRAKNLTDRLMDEDADGGELDHLSRKERLSGKDKRAERSKIRQTAQLRADDLQIAGDIDHLPIGLVRQFYSLYCDVEHPTGERRCVLRKTLAKLRQFAVAGDQVRFRDSGSRDESGRMEAVIEQILPRKTILTRAGSFLGDEQPIVANAEQMLIVTSLYKPTVKWQLIDRMLIAAQAGGMKPIICLNKIDLAGEGEAMAEMDHYQMIGFSTLKTSVPGNTGLDELARTLAGKTTVLAGQSGVGKSSLINAIQPDLDIRIGAVSNFNDKGRHTTTSARRYPLSGGGFLVDTPGVRQFGLWDVTPGNLLTFFPDVETGIAPQWRVDSYERILESLEAGKS